MFKLTSFLFSRGISLLNALVTSVFIARYLGPSSYGVIAYSVSLSTILTLLIPLGISSRVSLDLVENKYTAKAIITNSLLLRGLAALLTLLLVAIICTVFANTLDIKSARYVFILSALNLTNIFKIFEIYWLARNNSNLLSIIRIFSTLLALVLKFNGIISSAGLYYFVIVSGSEAFFSNLFVLISSFNQNLIGFGEISISYCLSLMKRSYPLCGNLLFTGLVRNSDVLLLSWFVPIQEIGLFAIAKKITSSFDFLPVETVNFFYHKIGMKNSSQTKKMSSLGSLIILLAVISSLFLLISSHFMINALYGPDFSKSANILNIFAVFMPFSFWYAYRKKFIVVHDKEKIVFLYSVFTALVLLLCSTILGPKFGAVGIAYASGLSFVISTIFAPFLFKQKLEIAIFRNSLVHLFLPIHQVKARLISKYGRR